MKTRRSWRNQNRLWRELGGPLPDKQKPVDSVVIAQRMISDPFTSPRDKRHYRRILDKEAERQRVKKIIEEEARRASDA